MPRRPRRHEITHPDIVRIKPSSHQPTKAEIEEAMSPCDIRHPDGSAMSTEDVIHHILRPIKFVREP